MMLDAYGMAAMRLGTRPRWKFGVVEGGRRRFGERTSRPLLDLKIIGTSERKPNANRDRN